MRLILASGSPARRAMLRQAGVACEAIPSAVDEAALKQGFTGPPEELALALARAKAASVALVHGPALVIGADQILRCGEENFDKPRDLLDASRQLYALRGRTHRLITAVCVMRGAEMLWSDVAQARLTMREFGSAFIEAYVRQEGEVICGCVGAYRLEGLGAQLFSGVDGDFFTILGLNLLPLLGFLRDAGALAA